MGWSKSPCYELATGTGTGTGPGLYQQIVVRKVQQTFFAISWRISKPLPQGFLLVCKPKTVLNTRSFEKLLEILTIFKEEGGQLNS